MKFKTKLVLGIIFLFIEFLVIVLYSSYSIFSISEKTGKMLKENNFSIQYAEKMQQAAEEIDTLESAALFNPLYKFNPDELSGYIKIFDENLNNQINNITESGEKEATQALASDYNNYKELISKQNNENRYTQGFYFEKVQPSFNKLKSDIYKISDINMNAIVMKKDIINNFSNHAYMILSIIGTIFLLASISFMYNFPRIIFDPIGKIQSYLKEIEKKNYDTSLGFKSNDELMEIEKSLNRIKNKLEKYENNDLLKSVPRKKAGIKKRK